MIKFTAMEECVDLINNNRRFNVIGWYKRGVINGKSLIAAHNINFSGSNSGNTNFNSTEEDVQVNSGETRYHIVSISPRKRVFIGPTTRYGTELSCLKLDVTQIEKKPTL